MQQHEPWRKKSILTAGERAAAMPWSRRIATIANASRWIYSTGCNRNECTPTAGKKRENPTKPQGAQGFAEAPAPGSLAPLNRLRAFRASASDMASCLGHDLICFYVTLRMKGAKIFALNPYAFPHRPRAPCGDAPRSDCPIPHLSRPYCGLKMEFTMEA